MATNERTNSRNDMKDFKVNSNRKTAVVAGIFFLLTEITAIGAIFLYGAVLSDPNYIVTGSAGGDNGVFLGCALRIAPCSRKCRHSGHALSGRQKTERKHRTWLCLRSSC